MPCRRWPAALGQPFVKPLRDRRDTRAARSTLVDVTDRKRAEALRDSEQRLSRILESAMDAIVTMDEEERIVLFNAAAEKVFRCSAAEAVGRPFGRFLSEGFRKALASYFERSPNLVLSSGTSPVRISPPSTPMAVNFRSSHHLASRGGRPESIYPHSPRHR